MVFVTLAEEYIVSLSKDVGKAQYEPSFSRCQDLKCKNINCSEDEQVRNQLLEILTTKYKEQGRVQDANALRNSFYEGLPKILSNNVAPPPLSPPVPRPTRLETTEQKTEPPNKQLDEVSSAEQQTEAPNKQLDEPSAAQTESVFAIICNNISRFFSGIATFIASYVGTPNSSAGVSAA